MSELFLEVVVHPGVQERIVDGAAHGDDVGEEEDQGEEVPLVQVAVRVSHQIGQIERHPAKQKDDDLGIDRVKRKKRL